MTLEKLGRDRAAIDADADGAIAVAGDVRDQPTLSAIDRALDVVEVPGVVADLVDPGATDAATR
jgi:hypothetical protein